MISLLAATLVLLAAHGAVRGLEWLGVLSLPGLTDGKEDGGVEAVFGIVLRVALGLGGIGTLLLVVGAVAFPPGWVFMGMTVPLALAGAWLLPWRALLTAARPRDAVEAGLLFIAVAAISIMVSITLIPWLEIDEIVYHLAVPRAWLNEGRVVAFPTEVTSYFHFLSQMNTLWVMALFPGDVGGGRLLELARTILGMAGAGAITAWLYGRRAGLLVMTLGILLEDASRWGTTGQIDAGQAVYIVPAVGMMMRWLSAPEDRRALVLGSLLFGFLASVKNTGWFLLGAGLFAAGVIRLVDRLRFRRGLDQPAWKELVCLVLPALAAVLPWLVKNALHTGNPMFPFLWQAFPHREEVGVAFRQYQQYYAPDPRPLWERLLPVPGHLYVVISNVRVSNVNGLLYWAPAGVLALVLARRWGAARMDLVRWYPVLVAVPVALLFLHAPFWRFFIAAWPVAAIGGLGGLTVLTRTPWHRRILWAGGALLVYFAIQGFWSVNTHRQLGHRNLGHPPDVPPLTPAQVDAWFLEHDPPARFMAEVDALLGPEDRLLMGVTSFALPRLQVRFVPNVMCISDEVWFVMANWGHPAEEIAGWIARLGVTHLVTQKDFPAGAAREFADRYLVEVLRDEAINARLYAFDADGRTD